MSIIDNVATPPPPNWLSELEERRAKKLNARRLGHEAGAGAACLHCKEKCPGLDLHFWRKICKLCKCGKENHGVYDDDAFSGWLQFQLLGHKSTATLPQQMDWQPNGARDVVERYMKELPDDQRPLKGSARRLLLQKQVPMHDMDATLCDALSPPEIEAMKAYVKHLHESSAGVGQLAAVSQPKYAVFLNSNHKICADKYGHPITAVLDHFHTPIMDQEVVAALNGVVPSFSVLLDGNGGEMCTQHFNAYRKPLLDKFANEVYPNYGLLLDSNESTTKDTANLPIKVALDTYHRPKYDSSTCEKLAGRQPQFVQFLDRNDGALLDQHGNTMKNIVNPIVEHRKHLQVVGILDADKNPVLDQYGAPIHTQVDIFGQPIDKSLHNIARYTLSKPTKVEPIVYFQAPRIIDSQLQRKPQWSRLLQTLPNFRALSIHPPIEDTQNATNVRIGLISDLPAELHYNHQPPPSPVPAIPSTHEITTNNTSCQRCKKAFEDNGLAIEITRSTARWHTTCFRCAGCNQPLADLLYCWDAESGDVYCARDYAKIRGVPRCNACDELIFLKEYCLAEGMTYHVKHFSCFECDTPLADQDYLLVENKQPTCLNCYHRLKADVCLACRQIIAANEPGVRLQNADDHYHARDECFACVQCGKPLLGGKFLFRQRKLFCSTVCHTAATSL